MNHYKTETFDSKENRDRRFQELRKRQAVKFSGNRQLTTDEIEAKAHRTKKSAFDTRSALAVYISTWSVSYVQ